MLFKSQHLLRKLRKTGRLATAEVISIKTLGEGKSRRALWAPDEDLYGNWVDCLLVLRVVPHNSGDPPFEATVTTRVSPLRQLGLTVPVWYDPGDTRKVAVDHEVVSAG
jgi:hypothetical protein